MKYSIRQKYYLSDKNKESRLICDIYVCANPCYSDKEVSYLPDVIFNSEYCWEDEVTNNMAELLQTNLKKYREEQGEVNA